MSAVFFFFFLLISEQGIQICTTTATNNYNKYMHTETSMLKETYKTGMNFPKSVGYHKGQRNQNKKI